MHAQEVDLHHRTGSARGQYGLHDHGAVTCQHEVNNGVNSVSTVVADLLGVHAHVAGNGGDEAHELLVARQAHTDVPGLQVAGGLEGPLQEGLAVVEAEHAVVVLHVVVVQQLVNVLHLVSGTTVSQCGAHCGLSCHYAPPSRRQCRNRTTRRLRAS